MDAADVDLFKLKLPKPASIRKADALRSFFRVCHFLRIVVVARFETILLHRELLLQVCHSPAQSGLIAVHFRHHAGSEKESHRQEREEEGTPPIGIGETPHESGETNGCRHESRYAERDRLNCVHNPFYNQQLIERQVTSKDSQKQP